MSRKDQRRRERHERERLARGKTREPTEARPVPPPGPSHAPAPAPDAPAVLNAGDQAGQTGGAWQPGVSANPQTQWQPGQSGNPAGYSRARRTTDGMLEMVAKRGADNAICVVWLQQMLAGNFKYFKEWMERTEGRLNFLPEDVSAALAVAPVIDTVDPLIDPETIIKMLEAADPTTIPILEEDEPT